MNRVGVVINSSNILFDEFYSLILFYVHLSFTYTFTGEGGRGGWNLSPQLGAEFGKMRYNLRLTQDSGSTFVEYGVWGMP